MLHQHNVIDVILVFLLLFFITFLMMFQCFHCWLWTGKCQKEYNQWNPNTIKKQYHPTLNLSMCFRVRYKSTVIFKIKLFVTTVNSLHLLAYFWHKELHLRCCMGLKLNIVKWSMKMLKGIEGYVEKIWKIHSARCSEHTFPEVCLH